MCSCHLLLCPCLFATGRFTNCYPPPGTIGIAWIAILCASRNGAGLSSVTQTHWLNAAHEIGHNFGGNHAFQEGQGRTGQWTNCFGENRSVLCSDERERC